MLPYVAQPVLHLGPLPLHAFGLLVAMAVLVGSAVAQRRARAIGFDEHTIQDLLTWIVAGGFLGGHVLDLLFYEPAVVLHDPLRLLRLWDGLGSFGGFVGAVAGAALYLRRHAVRDAWRALDVIAYAFPFGWIFGRLGCTLAFDHPGRATTFFLGERYTDGVVRHNLGLDEALFTVVIAALFFAVGRKARASGTFVGLLALVYAPVRFAMDALRIADTRYFGLTPAQYGSALLAVVGIAILALRPRLSARDEATTEDAATSAA